MAHPEPYEVDYSFAGFQANSPTTPLPGARLDDELAAIETAVADLVYAIKDLRDSEGGLKAGVVTLESLSVGALAGLANLDEEAAEQLDDTVAALRAELIEAVSDIGDSKAPLVHTHAATAVSVSAISGISGATVQAVLAELRALGPQTGDVKLSMVSTAPSGWVPCNDGTIGDASSNATTRANADCAALFAVLWNEVSDTYAPVSTGRGASAAADFAAHKTIGLTKMLGRALAIAGAGTGLTARAHGFTVGTETHTLVAGEMPAHTHTINVTDPGHTHAINVNHFSAQGGGTAQIWSGIAPGGSSTGTTQTETTDITAEATSTGGGGAHTNMQPTTFLKAFLKL